MEKIYMSLQGIFSEEKSYRCQKKTEKKGVGQGGKGAREETSKASKFSPGLLWG